MKKAIILALLLVVGAVLVSAQQATITEISGKVEIRQPGGSWQAAEQGMTLPLDAYISTGFGARATIEAGNATFNVAPITRVALTELAQEGDTAKTDMFLRVGRVDTEVKDTEGIRNDVNVRSPYSTASVRGTEWVQTLNSVSVTDGTVLVRIGPPPSADIPAGDGDGDGGEEDADDDTEEGGDGEGVEVRAGNSLVILVPTSAGGSDGDEQDEGEDGEDEEGDDEEDEEPQVVQGEQSHQRNQNTRTSMKPDVNPPADPGSFQGGGAGVAGGPAGPPPRRRPVPSTGSITVDWAW